MSNERIRWAVSILAALAVLTFALPAGAARRFTSVQLNVPSPVEVTMGDTTPVALTYRITNTSTGGDAGRGIYRLRFTAPAGFAFTGASVLPAGWAVTGTGATLTLQTSNSPCTNCIYTAGAGGAPKDFTITLGTVPAATQDTTSTLSIQSLYTGGKTRTNAGQAFVTRRALTAALVAYLPAQCTPDCSNWGATCAATPSIAVTGTHSLALIVRNNSTAPWTGIISTPNPPTEIDDWGPGVPAFSSPATLSLAANGACGVVVWTVTMPGSTGTVYYQARARNSTGVATSKLVTSNTVIVASPAASLGQHCVFPGEVTTVTMTVTNNGSTNLTNLRPWGIFSLLNGNHNAGTTTINVASTAGFPTPAGLIRIESEEISYTGTTATSFTGCTRGANLTTAAAHSNNTPVSGPRPLFVGTATPTYLSGPTPASFSPLAPAAVTHFYWTYRIDGSAAQTYSFRGFVAAFGTGITSPVLTSTAGALGEFGVGITSGATFGGNWQNAMTLWTIANNGCDPVRQVDIQVPGGFTVINGGLDSDISGFLDWSETFAAGTAAFSAGSNGLTALTGNHTATVTTLTVASTAGFPTAGTVQVDAERIAYTGTTPTTFTGCTRTVGIAMPHINGMAVYESRIATLNVNHDAVTTTISVAATAGFPSPAGSIRIDNEGISYTGITGTTFTGCSRAASGTAAPHSSGTTVYLPRLTVGQNGNFSLLYSALPVVAGGFTFPVIVTDRAGRSRTVNTTVTIDLSTPAPGVGDLRLWQEPTR